MINATNKKSKGFTLIELLVVIAIIAILAAILFPVFAQAKNAAKKSVDMSNMKQSMLGLLMYVSDYDDVMPVGGWGGDEPLVGWKWYSLRLSVMPYIKSKNIFEPPGFRMGSQSGPVMLDYQTWYEDYRQGISMGIAGIHSWAHPGYAPNGLNMGTIPRVAGLVSLVTSRYQYGDVGTWTIYKTWLGTPQYPGKGTYVAYSRVANWAFFDGHGKSINPCSTFGKLQWLPGQEPAEDFLWEWWSGPDSNVLRSWQQGATPGYQTSDYGCVDIDEYSK